MNTLMRNNEVVKFFPPEKYIYIYPHPQSEHLKQSQQPVRPCTSSAVLINSYIHSCLWRRQWHPTPVLLHWKIPRTEEPGRLQSMGSLRVGHHWATSLSGIGEGNGSPLQCSCLENPRDGGAWWAAVYGVAQSRTRLKRLSSSGSIHAWTIFWIGQELPLSCPPLYHEHVTLWLGCGRQPSSFCWMNAIDLILPICVSVEWIIKLEYL